ncbi:hypothetical protein [Reinekea marinisedimentorum]|uniref:Phage integrase family protein n=1 Tax=Reinekea marinisedimentorum TaxID=230495 RepID=A0A4R3I461_9GAMM|nr:hypothetical protein [Reinekea marinisedimentorum]TCS40086.1 hypothetical protein BCF53_1102 [Reinekea marinisedimentorum]
MSSSAVLLNFLHKNEADNALVSISSRLNDALPPGVSFTDDQWNIIDWFKRPGNSKVRNLDFSLIQNQELKLAIKTYLVEKRLLSYQEGNGLAAILPPLCLIDEALGARPFNKITNAVFEETQELIQQRYNKSVPYRMAGYLELFGKWLAINFGLRITYTKKLNSNYYHGRKATDEDRENKLIHPHILVDLINANQREDLIERDKFYLSVFTLLIGTGFRINELATLPEDSLIEEGDRLGIRFFPEKKPKLDVRWIPNDWHETVKDAYERILRLTDSGRTLAAEKRKSPGLDWTRIMQDPDATRYFVIEFCHQWTSNLDHHLLIQGRAWFQSERRYIDIISLIGELGSKSAASRLLKVSRHTVDYLLDCQLRAGQGLLPRKAQGRCKGERTDWDTDSRVISMARLFEHTNISKFTNKECHEIAIKLIEDARDNYQLKGKTYPLPESNSKLEKQFQRKERPIIKDDEENAVLWPEEALLVIPKYSLTSKRRTKHNEYYFVSDGGISRWLCGELRSLGTGKEEDSVFSRLNIIDPKTEAIAKFTSHDIRHWLTTYYLEGGMPSEQVALLFNRSEAQNHVYDQTLSTTRLKSLKNSIKEGNAIGHVADTYSNIATYSRKQAEEYLEACTLQMNLMPHGGCSLNWGMESCQNHNACFNSPEGVCKSLCLDLNDPETKKEVVQLHKEAASALLYIPETSPQHSHYQSIKQNIESTGVLNHE